MIEKGGYRPEYSPWVVLDHEWKELTEGYDLCCYTKGHTFFSAGESCEDVYLLSSGRVAMNFALERERIRTVVVLDRGCIFGNSEWQDMDGLFAATVMSDEAYVYCIPKQVADEILNNNNKLIRQILIQSNRMNRILIKQLELLNVRDAKKRVAFHLVNLANQYYEIERTGDEEKKVLIFQFTHQELSEAACLSREAVSKVLSQFTKEGILKRWTKHRYIVLDEEALERAAII